MKKVYALFTFRIDALKAKIIQSKINLHQEDKPTPAFAKDLECTICLEIPKSKPGSQVGEQFDQFCNNFSGTKLNTILLRTKFEVT